MLSTVVVQWAALRSEIASLGSRADAAEGLAEQAQAQLRQRAPTPTPSSQGSAADGGSTAPTRSASHTKQQLEQLRFAAVSKQLGEVEAQNDALAKDVMAAQSAQRGAEQQAKAQKERADETERRSAGQTAEISSFKAGLSQLLTTRSTVQQKLEEHDASAELVAERHGALTQQVQETQCGLAKQHEASQADRAAILETQSLNRELLAQHAADQREIVSRKRELECVTATVAALRDTAGASELERTKLMAALQQTQQLLEFRAPGTGAKRQRVDARPAAAAVAASEPRARPTAAQ